MGCNVDVTPSGDLLVIYHALHQAPDPDRTMICRCQYARLSGSVTKADTTNQKLGLVAILHLSNVSFLNKPSLLDESVGHHCGVIPSCCGGQQLVDIMM